MKTSLKGLLFLALFAGFSHGLAAQGFDAKIDSYFKPCAEQKTDIEMSHCLGRQYAIVDAQVKRVWRDALQKIDNNQTMPASVRGRWKHNFRASQDFWVRYKEAECSGSVPYNFGQGRVATVKSLECFVRVAAVRLAELKAYVK